MFADRRFTLRGLTCPTRIIIFLLLLCFGMLSPTAAQESTLVEPEAGTWPTWVLESGSQFRVAAPPDDGATADEIAELQAMVDDRDEAALLQIAYWNAGPPAYRWNQIAVDAIVERAQPGHLGYRGLSLLHVAIYDATVAAWDSKYIYNRPRPSDIEPALNPVIPNPPSPSYPSEYAVTAGAASAVLAYLFPEEAERFEALAQEAVTSRLLAGVEYPSDVEAGLELGRQVAQLTIAHGQADGSDAAWEGSFPTEAGMWTGENPIFPGSGVWQSWTLTSGDQFRPDAPPAFDSEETAAEMDELRSFERTPVTSSTALFWEYASGGRRTHWFWNEVANRLILENRLDVNAPRAAEVYALMNVAGYDAHIACWDAKYSYWRMRPFQVDTEFTPLFTTPNHPAYPSAHSCISTAVANVLADLFPVNAAEVIDLANEASESRIWAGIHYRSDIEAGQEIGRNVADGVLALAASDSGS
jgi:membrane-associated phospholipid phosphatase